VEFVVGGILAEWFELRFEGAHDLRAGPAERGVIAVTERAHLRGIQELLEEHRHGKAKDGFAVVQCLAEQIVPAIGHGVGAGGEILQDPAVVVRAEDQVPVARFLFGMEAVDAHFPAAAAQPVHDRARGGACLVAKHVGASARRDGLVALAIDALAFRSIDPARLDRPWHSATHLLWWGVHLLGMAIIAVNIATPRWPDRLGLATALSPLPLQYADYAAWQRGAVAGARLQEGLEFWTKELAGLPELLPLPTD